MHYDLDTNDILVQVKAQLQVIESVLKLIDDVEQAQVLTVYVEPALRVFLLIVGTSVRLCVKVIRPSITHNYIHFVVFFGLFL